jgi:hypothetical protein
VLLVSHNLRQIERICNRAILLESGKIAADGPPAEVCNLFIEKSDAKIREQKRFSDVLPNGARYHSSGELELLEVKLLDEGGKPTDKVTHHSNVTLSILFKSSVKMTKPVFAVGLHTTDFLYLATELTGEDFERLTIEPGIFNVRCEIKSFPFLPGIYSFRLGVATGDLFRPVFYSENIHPFQVLPLEQRGVRAMNEGFISLETSWSLNVSGAESDIRDQHAF